MNVKRKIYLINDYEDGVHSASAKEIKNGLSLRGIYVQSAHGGHYYGGMVWGGDLKSSDILILLHSQISSNSGEIQSIVKWAKDNKKPLIIVTLDDTPLTGAWELILTDYMQYQIIKYNEENPNDTIFELEESITNNVTKQKSVVSKRLFIICKYVGVLLYCIFFFFFIYKVSYDNTMAGGERFAFIICIATMSMSIYLSFATIKPSTPDIKPLRKIKPQNKNIDKENASTKNNNTVMYKCFIAGATTISEERDAVRASFSQVANKWTSFNIRLYAYTFEDFDNNHQQQMRYDEFIRNEADCVIVIIADGIGEKTIGEYRLAVQTLAKNKKRPKVVVYADERSKDDPNVIEFKKEVEKNKTYWVSYTSLNELKEKIQNEMTKQLLPIVQEIIKKS